MATLAANVGRALPRREEDRHALSLTYHRLMLVLLIFAGVTALIVLRLAYLQVFTDRAGGVQVGNPLTPPRADIVDRNGLPLARTIDAWSIGLHPRRVIGDRAELAQRLHALMPERSVAEYRAMLSADSNYLYLARRAVPELVASINALGEPGIVFNREPERLYPQTALAGHVLGWTDFDGRGVAGIERQMEGRLTDPRRRADRCLVDRQPRSVDEWKANRQRGHRAQTRRRTGIILDVETGEASPCVSADLNPTPPAASTQARSISRERAFTMGSPSSRHLAAAIEPAW